MCTENFEDEVWRLHRVQVVFGAVSRAAWWPPNAVLGIPAILVAPGEAEARVFLEGLGYA